MQENHFEILQRFLSIPVEDGSEVFQLFSQLPGAVTGEGEKPLERYVFVPGTRKDGVVLVAHADTVWDRAYDHAAKASLIFRDGVFSGESPDCGIGADDRAGCAMLWALRDSGHSLLVVDGEEHGKRGAKFLRQSNKKLFRRLNRHRFMLELDWRGTNGCLYNQVENSQKFKDYITSQLGFTDDQKKGGCDLQVLCRNICGVNLGIGYHNYHTPGETLVLAEWENTLKHLTAFLSEEQPKFPIPRKKQLSAWLGRVKLGIAALLKTLKLRK